jgi:hypothetical protein
LPTPLKIFVPSPSSLITAEPRLDPAVKIKVRLSEDDVVCAIALKFTLATRPLAVLTPGVGIPRVIFIIPFAVSITFSASFVKTEADVSMLTNSK